MDWPRPIFVAPTIMHPHHPDALGGALVAAVLNAVTATPWVVANKAYYYPFKLYDWATVYQLMFFVGSASSGNVDIGIYDGQGNRIVSAGSTAMSATANTIQVINVTDTVLPPGDYFLALARDTTSGNQYATGIADELGLSQFPIYEEASAFPLPATATPVKCTDNTVNIFSCGAQLVPTF